MSTDNFIADVVAMKVNQFESIKESMYMEGNEKWTENISSSYRDYALQYSELFQKGPM